MHSTNTVSSYILIHYSPPLSLVVFNQCQKVKVIPLPTPTLDSNQSNSISLTFILTFIFLYHTRFNSLHRDNPSIILQIKLPYTYYHISSLDLQNIDKSFEFLIFSKQPMMIYSWLNIASRHMGSVKKLRGQQKICITKIY